MVKRGPRPPGQLGPCSHSGVAMSAYQKRFFWGKSGLQSGQINLPVFGLIQNSLQYSIRFGDRR